MRGRARVNVASAIGEAVSNWSTVGLSSSFDRRVTPTTFARLLGRAFNQLLLGTTPSVRGSTALAVSFGRPRFTRAGAVTGRCSVTTSARLFREHELDARSIRRSITRMSFLMSHIVTLSRSPAP